jgi:hypothetical protein
MSIYVTESMFDFDIPEDQSSSNTSNTTHTNQRRRAECTLPLSTDVVGLVRHDRGHVAIRSRSCEEDSEVPDARALVETHDRNTNDTQDHVEDDDGPSNVVLVTGPTSPVHNDRCERVWWSNKTLRRAGGEAHVLGQDDWEEVRKSVCDGCCVEEDLNLLAEVLVAT